MSCRVTCTVHPHTHFLLSPLSPLSQNNPQQRLQLSHGCIFHSHDADSTSTVLLHTYLRWLLVERWWAYVLASHAQCVCMRACAVWASVHVGSNTFRTLTAWCSMSCCAVATVSQCLCALPPCHTAAKPDQFQGTREFI